MSDVPDLATLGDILNENLNGMSAYRKEDIKPLSDEQLETLKRADVLTSNALFAIHNGIAVIGTILARIGDSESDHIDADLLSAHDLMKIGWLIHSLAGLAENLHSTARDAAFIRGQQISIDHV